MCVCVCVCVSVCLRMRMRAQSHRVTNTSAVDADVNIRPSCEQFLFRVHVKIRAKAGPVGWKLGGIKETYKS